MQANTTEHNVKQMRMKICFTVVNRVVKWWFRDVSGFGPLRVQAIRAERASQWDGRITCNNAPEGCRHSVYKKRHNLRLSVRPRRAPNPQRAHGTPPVCMCPKKSAVQQSKCTRSMTRTLSGHYTLQHAVLHTTSSASGVTKFQDSSLESKEATSCSPAALSA